MKHERTLYAIGEESFHHASHLSVTANAFNMSCLDRDTHVKPRIHNVTSTDRVPFFLTRCCTARCMPAFKDVQNSLYSLVQIFTLGRG